ncbi:uncharacterized protein J7T54_005573 [Emericellopsis cladophorae]|uniref:C3H1-type domain-containing protein n=1 Tax=Emericellopsis cladophorae TaxID=2686198 RepID=A0A9Q0BGN6_9HYPO|nr:uncharacterized protein J7T54_005573 [Emericellopsis cladophorae]KAI6783544.1 hypothetical protein J7T54_005573 [Emericellopsis cladophorae]
MTPRPARDANPAPPLTPQHVYSMSRDSTAVPTSAASFVRRQLPNTFAQHRDNSSNLGLTNRVYPVTSQMVAAGQQSVPRTNHATDMVSKPHRAGETIWSTVPNVQWHNYATNPPTPTNFDNLSAFQNLTMAPQQTLTSATHMPELTIRTDGHHVYLDRGGGKVTRLVAVDRLPSLQGVSAVEDLRLGMEIVSSVRALGLNERVMVQASPLSSVGLQSQLHFFSQWYGECANDFQQHRTAGSVNTKKTKIYCDKWIHEGICAFEQQGCRFKHEMPQDKDILQSLGLYNGVPPIWWRKHQAEKNRRSPGSAGHKPFDDVGKSTGDRDNVALASNKPDANWRRSEGSMQAGEDTPENRDRPFVHMLTTFKGDVLLLCNRARRSHTHLAPFSRPDPAEILG